MISGFLFKIIMNHIPLTIHMRMIKACNADCSYCSSWQENPDQRMKPAEFKTSIDNCISLIERLDLGTTHVSLQYIGGEILLIPESELQECVEYARRAFGNAGMEFRDGVQSNLIGSERRVKGLFELFDGRVGTSIDSFSDKRTVNNSSEKYNLIFSTRDTENTVEKDRTPAIYTFDGTMTDNVIKEVEKAEIDGRNLTIKGVFTGGKDVTLVNEKEYEEVMMQSLESWFLKGRIILEPFYSMLERHISNNYLNNKYNLENCHFQANCASRSMDIEPNGDLYVCQDLADKGVGKLGNLLRNEFIYEEWVKLNKRSENLDPSCISCEFLKSCHSGCMVDALESGKGIYDKSPHCNLWKKIFTYYDKAIERNGISHVTRWQRRLNVLR